MSNPKNNTIVISLLVAIVLIGMAVSTMMSCHDDIKKNTANEEIAQGIEWKTMETLNVLYPLTPDTIKQNETETHLRYYFYITDTNRGQRYSTVIDEKIYVDYEGKKWIGEWRFTINLAGYVGSSTSFKEINSPFNLIVYNDAILDIKPTAYLKKLSPEQKISFDFLSVLRYKLSHQS